ncbi:MAG: hypothetical protein ACYDH6_13995 [Acidimicrobiales bacterium]
MATSQKLSGLASATTKAQFDLVAKAFSDLAATAPADVKDAINDLVGALQEASAAYTNPSSVDYTKLQDFGKRLPADSQKISTYAAASCAGK